MLEKKRYLLVEIAVENGKLGEREAKHLLYAAAFEFLGELGAARAGLRFKAFDERSQRAVIKCRTDSLEQVVAALALKRFHSFAQQRASVALRASKASGVLAKLVR
jgi:RNase P/RNase MRP subunit POP5